MNTEQNPLHIPFETFDPTAILVIGAGGHGKSIVGIIQAMRNWRIVGFIDDSIQPGTRILDIPVVGSLKDLEKFQQKGIRLAANGVGGINKPQVRINIFAQLARAGFVCPSLVHPSSVVEPSASLEAGVQVMPNCYIGPDCSIGFGSVLNNGVCLSHDTKIGRVVNLSPNATLAGGVTIDDFSQIGMGATINLNVSIGSWSRVGNSATIKDHVPDETIVRAGTIWPIRDSSKNKKPAEDQHVS
ncbi:MAG: NeuD/PglB/VioB family sugar acetyltransferase [Anaerolineaceae bacterium]|nr:NeuD/PglB/VioB family sugar acetyltransferase [Anaerolineaceae bacterium]